MSMLKLSLLAEQVQVVPATNRAVHLECEVHLEQFVETAGEQALDEIVRDNKSRILDLIGEEYVKQYFAL